VCYMLSVHVPVYVCIYVCIHMRLHMAQQHIQPKSDRQ
jgi:hypothetical protein